MVLKVLDIGPNVFLVSISTGEVWLKQRRTVTLLREFLLQLFCPHKLSLHKFQVIYIKPGVPRREEYIWCVTGSTVSFIIACVKSR